MRIKRGCGVLSPLLFIIFIARQHTDARDIDIANLSVRLSVRPLSSCIVWKRLNILS